MLLLADPNCPIGRERGNHTKQEGCTCRWGKDPGQLLKMIEWARREWRNDGAEGETVHVLCDELEARIRARSEVVPDIG